MKNIILVLTFCISTLIVGCSPKNPTSSSNTNRDVVVTNILQAAIGNYIYDGEGRKYKKITNEEFVTNGVVKIEIWERVDPLVTNYWYTPTLGSKVFSNGPVGFNSIYRIEGENYPSF